MYSRPLKTLKWRPETKLLICTRRRSTATLFVLAAAALMVLAHVHCTTTKSVDVSGATQIVVANNTRSVNKREVLSSTVPKIMTELNVICNNSGSCVTTSAKEFNIGHFPQQSATNFNLQSITNSSVTKERLAGKARVPPSHRQSSLKGQLAPSEDKVRDFVAELNLSVTVDSGMNDGQGSSREDQVSFKGLWTPWESCLRIGTDPRIVGGVAAKIEDHPFMASLQFRGYHSCGSCIVSHYWLLTAAHCFMDYMTQQLIVDPANFSIVAGTAYITNNGTGRCSIYEEWRPVYEISIHPHFDMLRMLPDLAMVRVNKALPMRKQIWPAKLPEGELNTVDQLHADLRCYVAGWGSTKPKRRTRPRLERQQWVYCQKLKRTVLLPLLQKVELPLITTERCRELYKRQAQSIFGHTNLCTLSTDDVKDACTGDSGGPLICLGYVVGLVSWGRGCAGRSSPGVYARVDTQLDWVLETMGAVHRGSVAGVANVNTAIFCWLLAAGPHLMSLLQISCV